MSFHLPNEKSQFQTPVWSLNKKIIEILTKIGAKITIIVVENGEPYYFIIIYKCKEVPLSLFPYQMLASTFDSYERSSYYKVYVSEEKYELRVIKLRIHSRTLYVRERIL